MSATCDFGRRRKFVTCSIPWKTSDLFRKNFSRNQERRRNKIVASYVGTGCRQDKAPYLISGTPHLKNRDPHSAALKMDDRAHLFALCSCVVLGQYPPHDSPNATIRPYGPAYRRTLLVQRVRPPCDRAGGIRRGAVRWGLSGSAGRNPTSEPNEKATPKSGPSLVILPPLPGNIHFPRLKSYVISSIASSGLITHSAKRRILVR
jgi:hypothetical protein